MNREDRERLLAEQGYAGFEMFGDTYFEKSIVYETLDSPVIVRVLYSDIENTHVAYVNYSELGIYDVLTREEMKDFDKELQILINSEVYALNMLNIEVKLY